MNHIKSSYPAGPFGASGPTGPTGATGAYGTLVNNHSSGQMYHDIHTNKLWAVDGNGIYREVAQGFSVEEKEKQEKYRLDAELRAAEQKEKLEALRTIFPRGYNHIDNMDIIVDIARENQLNGLYEQVLAEFENAQTALHRAANKLASAVKLTDSDEITERSKVKSDSYSHLGNTSFTSPSYSATQGWYASAGSAAQSHTISAATSSANSAATSSANSAAQTYASQAMSTYATQAASQSASQAAAAYDAAVRTSSTVQSAAWTGTPDLNQESQGTSSSIFNKLFGSKK